MQSTIFYKDLDHNVVELEVMPKRTIEELIVSNSKIMEFSEKIIKLQKNDNTTCFSLLISLKDGTAKVTEGEKPFIDKNGFMLLVTLYELEKMEILDIFNLLKKRLYKKFNEDSRDFYSDTLAKRIFSIDELYENEFILTK